jgi:hypothetical protein
MMAPQEVLSYLKAEPFRPFCIRTASGRTYEIRHRATVAITRTALVIFSPVRVTPDIYEKWETASLGLIQSISHLESRGA